MRSYRRYTAIALVFVLAAPVIEAGAAGWEISGQLTASTRHFSEAARWPDQQRQPGRFTLEASPELRWRSEGGNQRASLIPFLRWDEGDDERSLSDLREAYWAQEWDGGELLLGVNTLFWGVTESTHLVDIINQTDGAGDPDGEQKLGQPMLSLATLKDWGQLSLFALPYFRERTVIGAEGRLRPPLPVDDQHAVYASEDGRRHLDWALRYSHYIGDVDLGLSLFRGTSREPRLLPGADARKLVAHYDQITQAGLDLQLTRDAWLWKLETIRRDGHAETFTAAVGGFEYTRYQVGESSVDVGLLMEYQYDGRGAGEPITLADNDLFLGTRIALNDTQDSSLLAGIVYDLDTEERLLNIEAERRIGERMVAELRARLFAAERPSNAIYSIARDDYVEFKLGWYF